MIGMFGPMKRRNMPMGQAPEVGAMQPPVQPEMRVTAPAWGPEDEKPKGGLFGDPNFADKLSAIGGMLMANAGNPMGEQLVQNYYAKQENDRMMQQRAAMAQQERMQGREDMQWEWQNKPQNPHRWESNDGSLMELGPDGQARVAYQDPTPKINWVMADDGAGGKQLIPVGPNGPLSAQPTPAPTAPIGRLTPVGQPAPQAAPQTRENRTVNSLKRNPQGAFIVESMQDYMMLSDGMTYVDPSSGQVMTKGVLGGQ